MAMDRRELLKYVGVGAIIAPVAAATPAARLVEVPKVEIIEASKIPDPSIREISRRAMEDL